MGCKMPWWAGSETPPPDKDKTIAGPRAEVASLKEERDELAEFKSAALVGFNVAEGRIESLTQQLAAANGSVEAMKGTIAVMVEALAWADGHLIAQGIRGKLIELAIGHGKAALSNLNEDSQVAARDLLPAERDCCGTFMGSQHRATCPDRAVK